MSLRRFAAVAAVLLSAGCAHGSAASNQSSGTIPVVTTISTFNSLVEGVGGSHVTVRSLVPVGASPETYQPTPQDVATLSQAAILVKNGAGLETWLDRTIANAGSSSLRVVDESAGLPVVRNNPHLWMDPENAKRYVDRIRDALAAQDPSHADEYRKNAIAYNAKLDALTASIRKRIATIPPDRRMMIVFHNAWQYYNDRFGITTLGFIEENPGQEPNPQSLARLIELARAHHVRAIFGEPEYNPQLARQLAANAGISVVDDLYDDSVGTNAKVADYISMLDYDTDAIVKDMR